MVLPNKEIFKGLVWHILVNWSNDNRSFGVHWINKGLISMSERTLTATYCISTGDTANYLVAHILLSFLKIRSQCLNLGDIMWQHVKNQNVVIPERSNNNCLLHWLYDKVYWSLQSPEDSLLHSRDMGTTEGSFAPDWGENNRLSSTHLSQWQQTTGCIHNHIHWSWISNPMQIAFWQRIVYWR